MAGIVRNWRVFSALLLSVVLIVGAYLLALGAQFYSRAEAQSESALLRAIATKDSDGDGLPDWEESLYGTDPSKIDSFNLGMTDSEAVAKGLVVPKVDTALSPSVSTTSSSVADIAKREGLSLPAEGTLTDALTKHFMTLYLKAKQDKGDQELTQEELRNIADESIAWIPTVVVAAGDYKEVKDLSISGTGTEAMIAFAADAEAVFIKNPLISGTAPVKYLKRAVESEDYSELPTIAAIADTYMATAKGLAALKVPFELSATDLLLVNAMMHMGQISHSLSLVESDPLATILALEQYGEASRAFIDALSRMRQVYDAHHIVLPVGTPGSGFLLILSKAPLPGQQDTAQTLP